MHIVEKYQIYLFRRKTIGKCSASLTFLPVFKARTNKFGIFRQCICIVYLSLRKHLTLL